MNVKCHKRLTRPGLCGAVKAMKVGDVLIGWESRWHLSADYLSTVCICPCNRVSCPYYECTVEWVFFVSMHCLVMSMPSTSVASRVLWNGSSAVYCL